MKIHGSSSGITFDCENERITASGEFFVEEGAIAGFSVSTSSLRHQNGEMLTTDECQELIRQYFVKNQTAGNKRFWQQNSSLPEIAIWRGFAFENVCFNHIEQIKDALGISGVISSLFLDE